MNPEVTRKGVVIVIDDDVSVRTALKELFESVGLEVKSYASGRAFLENGIPDETSCLVIDVRLSETSGFKFQEELARAQIHMRMRASGCFVPCERNSASHVSRGTGSIRTGWPTASAKPAAMSLAE